MQVFLYIFVLSILYMYLNAVRRLYVRNAGRGLSCKWHHTENSSI